jgi:hypothetical protein
MSTTEAVRQDEDLFPGEQYEVPFPRQDGKRVDEFAVSFAGRVSLNRNNPEHAKFVEDLTLGKAAMLQVLVSVDGKNVTLRTDDDGKEATSLVVRLGVASIADLE